MADIAARARIGIGDAEILRELGAPSGLAHRDRGIGMLIFAMHLHLIFPCASTVATGGRARFDAGETMAGIRGTRNCGEPGNEHERQETNHSIHGGKTRPIAVRPRRVKAEVRFPEKK